MAAARLFNIPGARLKAIEDLEHGSRVAYASDAELLAIVKSFRNRRILVTEQHVFLL
ncbi:MAG: hypothetical protein GYA24_05055 [Candidatus Lokiarchaeota archaeon]|nr:hypothetical protein [Candidatus Lokiarchaeota archaeon]